METYDTLTAALTGLKAKGYTLDFNIEMDTLVCSEGANRLKPEDFEITEVHRFEGDTNPDDEEVVYAIASHDQKIKGTFTGAFGPYADSLSAELLQKISMHK
ncbi:MAG: phosphoribosylpyrophosphate synthetase [Ferruginibacter sp.]